jgi:hypothetical protein
LKAPVKFRKHTKGTREQQMIKIHGWKFAVGIILFSANFSAKNADALETDSYSVWGKTLRDSRSTANAQMNAVIFETVQRANAEKAPQSCSDVVGHIGKIFRKMKNETNAQWAPFRNEMFPALEEELDEYFKKHSIYKNVPSGALAKQMPIAGQINLDGIYVGMDKLSHFFNVGHHYYDQYEKAIKKGKTHDQAVQAAIDWGIESEKSFYGLWMIAFSYADLEANYQGFKFYLELCEGPKPYVMKAPNGKWLKSSRMFDFHEYMNPNMDESFNANGYPDKKFAWIESSIASYCPQLLSRSPAAARRTAYSKRMVVSQSQAYVESLEKSGAILKRRSIEKICADNGH